MNKNKVNISQLSVILLLVITGGKFLSLPSVLARQVGHDSWLVLCVNFLWDAIGLGFLLWAVKINCGNLPLDEILNKNLSKAGSKVVLVVFFIIFVCRIILLMDSCYSAFAVTFDVNTNWVIFMLPIVVLSAFAISRGFNAVARVGQLLFGLIFLSIVMMAIYPATQVEFSQLLPVGEAGVGKIIGTAFTHSFWFSDYIFIYFVLEDLKPSQKIFAPMFASFAVGVVLTVFLNAVFVALFGHFAADSKLAMSKIGLFSVSQSTNGRWDWLTLSVWLISVMLKIVIFTFCAYKCVEKVFEQKFEKLNFVVMGALAVLMLLPIFVPVSFVVEYVLPYCTIPFALVQYLLPICMPFFAKRATRKNNYSAEAHGQLPPCNKKETV